MAYQARSSPKPGILMFPWLAIGHITPYLHLSNKLAERGYNISFLLPNKAQLIVQHLNLHPNLIAFHPISVPHVDGLPLGTQTTSDYLPPPLIPFLFTAMDLTRPQVEQAIVDLKPTFVFYDLAYWVPDITSKLGIKSVSYNVVSAAILGLTNGRRSQLHRDRGLPPTAEEMASPPIGYPSATVVLHRHEAHFVSFLSEEYGGGITFFKRINTALESADVIAVRTCREIEGKFCDYLSSQFEKPVLVTGPVLPDPATTESETLDEQCASWMGGHEPGSVIYCKLGTEVILEREQFQEILLGIEMAGYPFLIALKPPTGCSTVEEAMPEGFEERVRGKGVVYGGGVQQALLLKHPSIGCFVSHCGFGSMWEALLSSPQIVLMPQMPDQVLTTRIMAGELKVAVEVAKDETGWVPKETLCKAVKEVMDEEGEVGCLIRDNHAKWREALDGPDSVLGAEYIDSFLQKLSDLI